MLSEFKRFIHFLFILSVHGYTESVCVCVCVCVCVSEEGRSVCHDSLSCLPLDVLQCVLAH